MSNDSQETTHGAAQIEGEEREFCSDRDTILDNYDTPGLTVCKSCEDRKAAEGSANPAPLSIFYIQECDGGVQGEDLDMFVEASSADEAITLWAEEWEKDLNEGEYPARVYRLRQSGKAGVLGWDSENVERIR